MRYTSIKNISLEQIQFFLMIARLQSFTEAAEVLCVSQPMLSRRISMLEQELGLQLFNRERRQIRLTEDGEWLYTKWSDLLGQFEETLETAHRRRQCITIGCDEELWPVDSFLFPLIQPVQEACQNMDLSLECFDYPHLYHRLSGGMVDAVVTGNSEPPAGREGLCWHCLATVPHHLYINKKNPLAAKEKILWEDLKDEYFLTFSPATSEDYYRSVAGMCRQAGFEPRIKSYANKTSIMLNLWLNNGIHVGAHLGHIDADSIRVFLLPGRNINLYIGWRQDNRAAAQFAAQLCRVAEELALAPADPS